MRAAWGTQRDRSFIIQIPSLFLFGEPPPVPHTVGHNPRDPDDVYFPRITSKLFSLRVTTRKCGSRALVYADTGNRVFVPLLFLSPLLSLFSRKTAASFHA